MKKKIFATRVSTSEFFALLKKATNNNQDIKEEQQEFLRTGIRYYKETIPEPNLAIGKYTYELTDDAIVYHWPFECDGEGEYGYQKNAGSSPFAFRMVRSFYLKKFGQEYLDYLLGKDVATLNEGYQQTLKKYEKRGYQKRK